MIAFDLWAAFLLLPLPLVARHCLSPARPSIALRLSQLPPSLRKLRHISKTPMLLLSGAWLALVIALARPVWLGDPVSIPNAHRDVMLVLDLSSSMDIEDMTTTSGENISRMTAMKSVLTDFVARRQGDRLGMVLFADHGYLHTPLSLDINNLSQQIAHLELGLVGYMTAIGEGLAMATKTFIDSDAPQRVMLLLSDGSNTAGVIDPRDAARLAQQSDVTIYSIGLGAETMMAKTVFGEAYETNPSHDLDEALLTEVAELTGGRYFRARNPAELAEIYAVIDNLEPISESEQTWQPRHDLFAYPLLLSVLLVMGLLEYRRRDD
ncbi:VWA domain-containing protein [Thaumasiovibrio subtropicus]|uniref:VWA domain-containing protein n=1 Tax=Thaumasiovibrio subtropicus TaxID=1891207 RepID=UPI000B359B92|nr:VWA domain-containing protein [Thaumasiovibrio subtropicus]